MISEESSNPRGRPDRRKRPTNAWAAFRPGGRRVRPRRLDELNEPYFVDRIDGRTFTLAILLLVLTITDGAVTLLLLGAGCEEINPAMSYLLKRGPLHFLLGKYALTTAGLPFLLVFRHFTLFQTRVRVGHLLPVFVGLYLLLLGYQIALMQAEPGLFERTGSWRRISHEDKPGPTSYGRVSPSGPGARPLNTRLD